MVECFCESTPILANQTCLASDSSFLLLCSMISAKAIRVMTILDLQNTQHNSDQILVPKGSFFSFYFMISAKAIRVQAFFKPRSDIVQAERLPGV